MELTDLTVRLLLIFLPGIICYLVVDSLTVHRVRQTHEILIFSYIYGFLSYFSYGLLLLALATRFSANRPWVVLKSPKSLDLSVLRWLSDAKVSLDFLEIVCVTVMSLVLAYILSYCDRKKILHTIAQRTGASKKFGEPDVWNFAFNLNNARWCTVRDFNNKLMFQGYIRAFSDVGESAELLLTDVTVYNESTGELCYQADRMYLSRKKDDLTIQFQDLS